MFPALLHIASFSISYLKAAMCVSKFNRLPSFPGGNCLQKYYVREVLGYSSGLNALELELGASPSSRSDVSPAHGSK